MQQVASHFLKDHVRSCILWSWTKTFTVFQMGQIIGLNQAKKTTVDIAEITVIWLRNVWHIIKSRKDSGGPSTSWKKCGQKNLTMIGNHAWWSSR